MADFFNVLDSEVPVRPVTFHDAVVANGNGTSFDCEGYSVYGVQITGLGTATITFETTVDDTNWVATTTTNINTAVSATTTTTNGIYLVSVAGTSKVRCRISGYSAGTITVKGIGVSESVSFTQTSIAAAVSENITQWGSVVLTVAAALADGASAAPTTPTIGVIPLVMNATTEDRARAVVNALDSTGTGIAASGMVGQFDDAATGTVTENQFAPVRISSRRAVLVEGVASGTNVNVAIASSVPGTGATNLGKAEDAAHTSGDTGVMALAIQKAAPANSAGTDGDYEPLQMSAGRLWVSATVDAALPTGANVIGAVTQSGTWNVTTVTTVTTVSTVTAVTDITNWGNVIDNAAFTDGTTRVLMAGFIYDDVAGTALTENDAAAARINVNRAVVAAIEDGVTRARYVTVTAANALKVDGSAVTQPVSGTVTANAGTGTFTVDSELPTAAALADAASAAPTTPTVGSVPLLMNATTVDRARAVVNALDSTGTGIAAAGMVAQFDDTTPGTVTENQFSTLRMSTRRVLYVEGHLADGAADTGNSVKAGAIARAPDTMPADETAGDRVALQADLKGRLIVYVATKLDTTNDGVFVVGNAAHDAAASGAPLLMGAYASAAVPADVSADADAVRLWALRSGALAVNVTAAGALIAGDATNGLDVDVTRLIPGTTATALGKAEDAAHTTGDTGVMSLAVRRNTAAASSGTDGDYEPLQTDTTGLLRITRGGSENRVASGALGVLDAAVTINAEGAASVAWEVDTGTLAGTVIMEGTLDDTNWFTLNIVELDNTVSASLTAFGKRGHAQTVGLSQVRLRASAYTSGTSNARLEASWGSSNLVRVVQALPAGTNAIGKLSANSGVDVGDVDVTSVIPGTGATNLGKAVDAVAGATDTGVATLAIRDDALSALTPIEGDYVPLRADANGALWVSVSAALPAGTNAIGKLSANSGIDIGDVDVTSVIPGTGATNLGKAVDAVSGATDTGVVPLAIVDAALSAITPIDGDYAPPRVDANGALWVHAAAGTEAFGKLAANSGVDIGDVDVTSIIPGTGATNLGKAEDAAHVSADTGVMMLAVRNDAATSLSGTDGDYTPVAVTAQGYQLVVGSVAHDAADSGAPLKAGGKAISALPTAVTANDRTDIYATLFGALHVAPAHPGAGTVLQTMVDVGATSVTRQTLITPTTGKRIRLLSVQVCTNALATAPGRVGVYFGTGAAYTTTAAKAACEFVPGVTGMQSMTWPDGAGPVGAADDVLSGITETETETALRYTVVYREE